MDFAARPFRAGDEGTVSDLWNRAHSTYGGYVPRTPEFWTWNILERPGISSDDILLVTRGTWVAAFGVLGSRGAVLEFAVDTDLAKRPRRKAFRTLIYALEARARARRESGLSFTSKVDDAIVNSTLRWAGYRIRERDRVLGVGILDPREIVARVLHHNVDRLPQQWSRTFSLEILPGDYLVSPHGQLEIAFSAGELDVERRPEGQPIDCDCRISMDLVTLSEVIFTRLPFAEALKEGRIRIVSGPTADAERLCLALALHIPWHSPPSDLF